MAFFLMDDPKMFKFHLDKEEPENPDLTLIG
jgi:hypothetical protein